MYQIATSELQILEHSFRFPVGLLLISLPAENFKIKSETSLENRDLVHSRLLCS